MVSMAADCTEMWLYYDQGIRVVLIRKLVSHSYTRAPDVAGG